MKSIIYTLLVIFFSPFKKSKYLLNSFTGVSMIWTGRTLDPPTPGEREIQMSARFKCHVPHATKSNHSVREVSYKK